MGNALGYVSSSAVSLTVSGNTGISPFLTLFLLGVIEKSDPSLLQMDGWIETLLSSWISLVVLGALTCLEFVGKCVPVVDEVIDSIEVFVVPILSIFGSVGTMGLLNAAAAGDEDATRRLAAGGALLTFFKALLVIVGMVVALCIHFFKMLIRMVGLTCCFGCCQPCITMVEITMVLMGVLLAIFVRQVAIITCLIVLVAAGYAIYRKFVVKDFPTNQPTNNTNTNTDQAPTQPATTPPASATTPLPAATPKLQQPEPGDTPTTQATAISNAPLELEQHVHYDVENPDIPVIVLSAPVQATAPPACADDARPSTPPLPTNPDYVQRPPHKKGSKSNNNNNNNNNKKPKSKGKERQEAGRK